MKRTIPSLLLVVGCMVFIATPSFANIPAPPTNQLVGIDDTIFNNLTEADCRACHDDPNHPCTTSNVDRHHLLYGLPLKEGECSVNRNLCLSDGNCDPGICSETGALCTVATEQTDCPKYGLGERCGEVCIGETVAPILDGNGDGVDDTNYGCLNCHEQDNSGGVISFMVERNCLECHIQVVGEGSVHHLTDVAQGRDSPLGDDEVGDCTPCHGTIVDDIGDGHLIPPYAPSLVTPAPSNDPGEGGLPYNSNNVGAGACNYCHDAGIDDSRFPETVDVYSNEDTHHNTGVFLSETGVENQDVCNWCHDVFVPQDRKIRVCEGCHGYESLHNIQVDSDTGCVYDPADPGACSIVVGGEAAGWGHVGRDAGPGDSDCWGCHGFSTSSALGAGPVTPTIGGADALYMTAGTDTQFTLSGSAFTNMVGTSFEWVSDVKLVAADGSSVILTPDSVSPVAMTVTIPGSTSPGNYTLQAVKGASAASNPVAIVVRPEVRIDRVTNSGSTYTITGVGFGDQPPAGAEEYLNVQINGETAEVMSWSGTEIVASVSGYGAADAGDTITVNSLFCNADFQGSEPTEECGNDVIEGSEVCDGTALAGETCQTQGYDSGDLSCLSDCSGYDDSGCSTEPECIPDCYGNFSGDDSVDGLDLALFKADYGRNQFNNPCGTATPCNGDFDCDRDVDGVDLALFKMDFGRNAMNDPCQPCARECSY